MANLFFKHPATGKAFKKSELGTIKNGFTQAKSGFVVFANMQDQQANELKVREKIAQYGWVAGATQMSRRNLGEVILNIAATSSDLTVNGFGIDDL